MLLKETAPVLLMEVSCITYEAYSCVAVDRLHHLMQLSSVTVLALARPQSKMCDSGTSTLPVTGEVGPVCAWQ